MAMPQDVGIVDLMIGFPMQDKKKVYEYLKRGMRDDESKEQFSFPAEYMFKDVPDANREGDDPIATTFAKMDEYGVAAGLFGLGDQSREARQRFPGRVFFALEVDPNDLHEILSVDADGWKAALPQIKDHYAQFGEKLPPKLNAKLDELASALA